MSNSVSRSAALSFGYNNLVADMRSLYWLRDAGYRVIFDATHSVQRPGGSRGLYIGRWCVGAGAGQSGNGNRMRWNLHGGARKPRARVIGRAESDSPKGFAEATARVKGYSCCRLR